MNAYNIALFVHFLGLITLFGAFVIYPRAGMRLRAAGTRGEVRGWLGLLEATRPMFGAGPGLLFLSGLYMSAVKWKAAYPWIVVAFIGLVAISALAGRVGTRHLRAVRTAVGESDGPVPIELSRLIGDPKPWTIMMAMNGTAVGVVWIMTTKPGWIGAVGVVAVATALGAIVGSAMVRRGLRRPAIEKQSA
jgi:hypothetical protein